MLQLVLRRTDEHILYEVCLPCNFHDKTYFEPGIFICAAICIHYIYSLLFRNLFLNNRLTLIVNLRTNRFVDVSVPPHMLVAGCILYNVFVFRGTSGKNSSLYTDCTSLCESAFFETFIFFRDLSLKKFLIRGVVDYIFYVFDTVLCQIDTCHRLFEFIINTLIFHYL